MTDPRATRLDALQCLAIETAGYRALLDLLQAEQNALCSADADGLAAIVPAKLQQVSVLEAQSGMRSQMLANAGFTATPSGVTAWLSARADRDEALREWATLVGLADQAQRQNRINDHLARMQEGHIDRAIAALWSACGVASTYGADGRSRHLANTRQLATI